MSEQVRRPVERDPLVAALARYVEALHRRYPDGPEQLRREYLKHCGLKRFGRIDEVASLVSWLAVENTLVTGQTLVLDGAL